MRLLLLFLLLLLLRLSLLSFLLLPFLVRRFDFCVVRDQLFFRDGIFNALEDRCDCANVVRLTLIIAEARRAVFLQFGSPLGWRWGAVALDDAAIKLSAIHGGWMGIKI